MSEDQIMEYDFLTTRPARTYVLFYTALMPWGFDVLLKSYKDSTPLRPPRIELPEPDDCLKWGINIHFLKWELCIYTLTKWRVAQIKFDRYKREFDELGGYSHLVEE